MTPEQIRKEAAASEISKLSSGIREALGCLPISFGPISDEGRADLLIHQAWSLLGAARQILTGAPDLAKKTVADVLSNLTPEMLQAYGI